MGARKPNPEAGPGVPEPKLTEEVKVFVVGLWATFKTSTEIIAAVREEYGIDISENGVRWYKFDRPRCLPKWKKIGEEARAKWNAAVADIPIANAAYRLRIMQDLVDEQLRAPRKNPALLLETMEQAAKDVGGSFTARRELSGPDGGPIKTETAGALAVDFVANGAFGLAGAESLDLEAIVSKGLSGEAKSNKPAE